MDELKAKVNYIDGALAMMKNQGMMAKAVSAEKILIAMHETIRRIVDEIERMQGGENAA